jgi:formylglycine-generating enzyme required for sulfatase activity
VESESFWAGADGRSRRWNLTRGSFRGCAPRWDFFLKAAVAALAGAAACSSSRSSTVADTVGGCSLPECVSGCVTAGRTGGACASGACICNETSGGEAASPNSMDDASAAFADRDAAPADETSPSPSGSPVDQAPAASSEPVREANCSTFDCPEGMVYIPCGPFVMGSDERDFSSAGPKHEVVLSAYCVDTNEVTNEQFKGCVTAGACTEPHKYGGDSQPYYPDERYRRHPVAPVMWSQARAYCAWAGKRLPTEAEWEKAARGGCELSPPATCGPEDERRYPWGDEEPHCNRGRSRCCSCIGDPHAVGQRPGNDSPYGVHDMAGNADEWVADFWADDYRDVPSGAVDPLGPTTGTDHVFRGGHDLPCNVRASSRRGGSDQVGGSGYYFSFRCAYVP